MTDHVHDLRSLREATDRLLTAAAKLDNAALAEESLLPGWTRAATSWPTWHATRTPS